MKLVILLASGFGHEDWHTVQQLAQAARARQHEVSIFLMDDGVCHAPALAALTGETGPLAGVRAVWCTHNARQRGMGPVDGVVDGSLWDWAVMMREADRVITFG